MDCGRSPVGSEVKSDQILAGFRAFQSKIDLPLGAKWKAPTPADDEQYVKDAGFVDAITCAWTAWWQGWVSAPWTALIPPRRGSRLGGGCYPCVAIPPALPSVPR